MLGLESLQVYNSISNNIEKSKQFDFYTDTFDEFSFKELKDEVEGILDFSDITPSYLEHEILGPRTIQAYNRIRLEKSSFDGYIILLNGFARSPIRVFEIYLRIVVDLDEKDT